MIFISFLYEGKKTIIFYGNDKVFNNSFLTLMHVQSENGSVMKSNIPAKNVRTNAQNPGPSGSAETEKIKSSIIRKLSLS